MADDGRVCRLLDTDQVIERDHCAGVGTNVELPQVTWLRAELLVGLHVDAIRAIVEIEVVDVLRSHIDLQGRGDLRERHVQALRLFAIDRNQILRIARTEVAE